jgi:hypothetical protein
MNYRDELVILIRNGVTPVQIFDYFAGRHKLHRNAVMSILTQSGVSFPLPPSKDEITDERRRELQELSLEH